MDTLAHVFGPLTGIELSYAVRLIVAAALGMIVGLQRSITGKHAGMRTYAMVSLGAALFVTLGTLASYELSIFPSINPLQIAGSIVIGIGFIGSGLSTLNRDHIELTTASGVWVVAAIGMATGFGLYISAIVATALAVLIFTYFSRLEHKLQQRYGIEGK